MNKVLEAEALQNKEEVLVMIALANWSNDEGESWHTTDEIAVAARLTKRGLRNVIKRLEDGGWLEVRRTKGGRPRKEALGEEGHARRGNTFVLNVGKLRTAVPYKQRQEGAERGNTLPPYRREAPVLKNNAREQAEGMCRGDEPEGSSRATQQRGNPVPLIRGVAPVCGTFKRGIEFPLFLNEKGERKRGKRGNDEPRIIKPNSETTIPPKALTPPGGAGAARSHKRSDVFSLAQALKARWKTAADAPIQPDSMDDLPTGQQAARWCARVGVLVRQLGEEGIEERLEAAIAEHGSNWALSLWDHVGRWIVETRTLEGASNGFD